MEVVIDIEANGLEKPDKIWLIVCCDVASGKYHIFREVTTNEQERNRFLAFAKGITLWIGHNFLNYDYPVLESHLGHLATDISSQSIDTLIISKMVDFSRKSHSIEDYGREFGMEKGRFSDFSKYSLELEEYCIRDVDINLRIYRKYHRIIADPQWQRSIRDEHKFQLRVNQLHDNGFAFDKSKAETLLRKVESELKELDDKILEAFPPREVLIKEFTPKLTKHGTISRSSVPRALLDRIHEYEAGVTYRHTKLVEFNPASHKQIIAVLNEAGWKPNDKTQTHINTERELNRLRYAREGSNPVTKASLEEKLKQLKLTGWKVNEANLTTLPTRAPISTRFLARRILLESRRRTLTEWLNLITEDGRIHGKFYGIGAWTHRMSHQNPNTANIPSEFHEDGTSKLLGKEMRSLWRAPKNRLLAGVDAEGIQLRIFAHYINDPEFIDALVRGKKSDKTDPHSLNQRILGSVCSTRQAAKRFIYALLLGAGMGKLAQVLGCSESEARAALDRLLQRYGGFARLKKEVIPKDAARGWFVGLDGRQVRIPGDTSGERRHLCMSGYLQNGEAIVVKRAVLKTCDRLELEEIPHILTNVVHDEVIYELRNDIHKAKYVVDVFCESIEEVGRELNLLCPLAGDGHVGLNWWEIH